MPVERARFVGIRASIDEAETLLLRAGDLALVDRSGWRWVLISCPCGCGETVRVNLDRRAGPAWRLWRRRGLLTIYPSIWRDSGCGSHFIVSDNAIWLAGRYLIQDLTEPLKKVILDALGATPTSSIDIADQLDVSPWQVDVYLRELAKGGTIQELPARSGRWVKR